MVESVDVVVVGAGSAGGIAAARLSEDASRRVLLLEAGPDFPREATQLPLFAVSGENHWLVPGLPEFEWDFMELDRAGRRRGRPIRLPRGRLVGGSSMVNTTFAARPAPFDLDRWAALGNPGWDWASLLPYFIRIENDLDFGAEAIHGDGGPIVIQRYPEAHWTPVNHTFAEACDALGIRHAPDMNALDSHAGVFGPIPHNRHREVRQGTLVTYLRQARGRPNLVIQADAVVDRLLVEEGRAVGLVWHDARGEAHEVRAGRVLLSAGVYQTPVILQRSGIGPASLLRRHGIDVLADLPVGHGLTDHTGVPFLFKAPAIAGTIGRFFGVNWRGPAMHGPEPEWQTHPFPCDPEAGICGVWSYITHQQSKGTVELQGVDPALPPLIDHDYLSVGEDMARLGRAWEAAQALLATAPFRKAGAEWLEPVIDIEDHCRATMSTSHHQSGTCAMGQDPRTSVVGPDLRVHGIEGLWIADTSVFSSTVMHNTNLMACVVGEVAAERLAS